MLNISLSWLESRRVGINQRVVAVYRNPAGKAFENSLIVLAILSKSKISLTLQP